MLDSGSMLYTEWINMQKLAILGVKKSHIYMVLFMICIIILYIMLRPIIQVLLHKNAYKLLTYIISSLVLLVILMLITIMKEEQGQGGFTLLLKDALTTFTIFGMALIVINIVHYLFQKWMKKSV